MENLGLRLKIYVAILFVIMLVGTVGFMMTEDLSLSDSLYFSIVTVATVGYGDISPVTDAGKMLSIFLIITGVGTFLGVIANATEVLMNKQEMKVRMEKMNMVEGVFFSELGTRLLTEFAGCDPTIDTISSELLVRNDWTDMQFDAAHNSIGRHDFSVDIDKVDLSRLRDEVSKKGNVIVRLLENPSLVERETFTNLIKALLHLKDELEYREDFSTLPGTDLDHLAGDIKRVYGLLARQWLFYVKYLKANYPYLFSLAVRTNPFNKDRSPVVQ
jgi:uncharacterized protein YdcH (DUF465 family)